MCNLFKIIFGEKITETTVRFTNESRIMQLTGIKKVTDRYEQPPVFFKSIPHRLEEIVTLGKIYYPDNICNEAIELTLDNDFGHWIAKECLSVLGDVDYEEYLKKYTQ